MLKKRLTSILLGVILILSLLGLGFLGFTIQFIGILIISYGISTIALKLGIYKRIISLNFFIVFLPVMLIYAGGIIDYYLGGGVILHAIAILCAIPLGALLGKLLIRRNKSKQLIFTIFFIPFLICVGFIFMENWWRYSFVKPTHNLPIEFPKELRLSDNQNKGLDIINGNVAVLDLWTTSCRNCIKDFPKFQELSEKYRNSDKVDFYSVNFPLKGDSLRNPEKYVQAYTFKSLYAKDTSDAYNFLNIEAFPMYMIINKGGEIIYKGYLTDKWYLFYNNINTIIKDNI